MITEVQRSCTVDDTVQIVHTYESFEFVCQFSPHAAASETLEWLAGLITQTRMDLLCNLHHNYGPSDTLFTSDNTGMCRNLTWRLFVQCVIL